MNTRVRALKPGPSVLQSPYLVAAVVALLYLALLAALWHRFGGDPLRFVHTGTVFTVHDPAGTRGYDGQFYYYTAVDPLHSAEHMDNATFRLSRIFFPLVIMAASLGQPGAVPYAMIAINWLAIVGGTLLVALLLARWGRSPWFALSYALAGGIPVALTFDTAEPLAFGLIAAGVAAWELRRPVNQAEVGIPSPWLAFLPWPRLRGNPPPPPATETRPAWRYALPVAGLAFAAAILTRELAVYFVAGYGVISVWRRDWRGLLTVGLAFVPYLLWSAYLDVTLGAVGVAFAQPFEHIPFLAFWLQLGSPTVRSVAFAAQYMVPTVVFGVLALWRLAAGWRTLSPLLVAVLGNVHLITFLPRTGYQHQVAPSRYVLGLALAAVLWAGSARPRWLLWLTLLFVAGFLAYLYGYVTRDPAYLW